MSASCSSALVGEGGWSSDGGYCTCLKASGFPLPSRSCLPEMVQNHTRLPNFESSISIESPLPSMTHVPGISSGGTTGLSMVTLSLPPATNANMTLTPRGCTASDVGRDAALSEENVSDGSNQHHVVPPKLPQFQCRALCLRIPGISVYTVVTWP